MSVCFFFWFNDLQCIVVRLSDILLVLTHCIFVVLSWSLLLGSSISNLCNVYFLTASANSGSYTGLRSLLLFSAHRLRTPNEGLDQTNLKPQGQKRKKIQERRQETCKKARDVFCYLEKMDLTKQKTSWVRYLIIRGPAAFWMPNFQTQYSQQ